MFAGDPVTAVAVTVIGKVFVPLLSMTPDDVAVAVSGAAEEGKAPKAIIAVETDKAMKALIFCGKVFICKSPEESGSVSAI
jgi:hypothetical protein